MIEYIFCEQDLFKTYENKNPEYLYLGYEEMRKFMQEADIMRYVAAKCNPSDDMMFNGMKVFEVHKETHFNMC